MAFSEQVKRAAFKRSRGRCECTRKDHRHLFGRCALSLFFQSSAEFHHRHAQAAGGHDGVSNCEVLCRP